MSSVVPLGRYLLEGRLAFGGMSEVFSAHLAGPEGFKRRLVVKRLLPDLADRPDVVRLFLNEARIAARFHHPNLIQVHELFEAEGQYCLAMELLEGIDAGFVLQRLGDRREKLDPFAAAQIIADAAAGLHYAHELVTDDGHALGVVHRDVSPSNLFVTWQGVVKVVDFGIAKTHGPGVVPVVSDALRGKLPYMSPEQIDAQPLDRRSDIFSLGAVFYELLTGERAFDFEALGPAVETLRRAVVRPIRVVRYDVPEELAAIAHKMLARDPADRYATADEVHAAITRVVRAIGPRDVELKALIGGLFRDAPRPDVVRIPTAMIDAVPTREEQPPARVAGTEPLTAGKQRRRRTWGLGVAVMVVAGVVVGMVVRQRAPIAEERPPIAEDRPPIAEDRPPIAEDRAPIAEDRKPIAELPQPDPPTPLKRTKARVATRPAGPKRDGFVIVNADPWADVYLEGKKLGTTPLPPTALTEGTHTLELRNPDAKNQRVQVRVIAGKTAKVFTTMR